MNSEGLEDGELSGSDDGYTPLERPTISTSIQTKPTIPDYIESEEELGLSEDSDSDRDCKATLPKHKPKIQPLPKVASKKKNNIWANSVEDDVLVETLTKVDVSNIDRSRDVETYITGSNNKRKHSDRSNTHLRPFKRTEFGSTNKPKPIRRFILDLNFTVNDSEEDIAKDIANKLCEEKEDLIRSVVKIAGKEKAIGLFKETQQIEKEGGMLILNHTRRRTPGGVFLHLVKNDPELGEIQDQIFREEKIKFKQETRAREKIKTLKKKLKIKADHAMRLPELLSRQEIELKRANTKVEVELDVKNPPPSPATDGLDNSRDGMENLNNPNFAPTTTVEYEDDCLDIGLDMELH